MNELSFSSPGSPVIRILTNVSLKEIKKVIPKDLLGYALAEVIDRNKKVFYLIQPLNDEYPAFFVLKDFTIEAKEYSYAVDTPRTTH